MKIIVLGTDQKLFEKGGRVYNRIKEYSQFAEQYLVFVPTTDRNREKIIDGNFTVVPVFYKYKLFFLFNIFFAIRREKISNNNDIVISAQDPFEVGILSFIISRLFKYAFSVQVHTDISSKYFRRESVRNYFQFLLSKFIIRKADSVRVVSNKIKNYLIAKKINPKKIFLAPIFAGDIIAEKSNTIEQNEKENLILVLCRLEKVKNIDLAVKSFLEVIKNLKYVDYKLKIVGSGREEKNLKNKYEKYDNIIFEKFTDRPDIEYKKAKLFLLTSWYEGWGMTPIESVSNFTPVVMTPVGCANEFIFDNLNGMVSVNFKQKSFINAILHALENYTEFTTEKMQNSLKLLQTKDVYLQTLKSCHLKALE